MDPYIGEIRIFAGNFAPSGWALCQGQLLPINQNTALYSLLGTTYGGNGTTNFALPDLRGRLPVGVGQGTGLSNYVQGQMAGTENTTLQANNLPPHAHGFAQSVSNANATVSDPTNAVPAVVNSGGRTPATYPAYAAASNATGAPQTTGVAGAGVPFSTLQPYLALNFIIALQGIYPPRS